MRMTISVLGAAATAALLLLALPTAAHADASGSRPDATRNSDVTANDRESAAAGSTANAAGQKQCARKRKFPYPLSRHPRLRPHHRPSICR